MHWETIIRIINATGCIFVLWLLAIMAFREWKSWNDKTQAHWWAFFGCLFLQLEGSIESVILGVPPGPRTFLQTIVVAWCCRALLMEGKIEADTEKPWKRKE